MTNQPAPSGDPTNVLPPAGDPPAPTAAELAAQLAETRRQLSAANHESADRRKRLEDMEAAEETRKKAQMSALELAQKERDDAKARADTAEAATAEAQARATETLARAAVTTAAIGQKIDPAELTTLWLALRSDKALWARVKPKPDTDGEFEGVEDVVKEMLKAHPRWVATTVTKHDINGGDRSVPSDAAMKAASEAQGRQLRNRF